MFWFFFILMIYFSLLFIFSVCECLCVWLFLCFVHRFFFRYGVEIHVCCFFFFCIIPNYFILFGARNVNISVNSVLILFIFERVYHQRSYERWALNASDEMNQTTMLALEIRFSADLKWALFKLFFFFFSFQPNEISQKSCFELIQIKIEFRSQFLDF